MCGEAAKRDSKLPIDLSQISHVQYGQQVVAALKLAVDGCVGLISGFLLPLFISS